MHPGTIDIVPEENPQPKRHRRSAGGKGPRNNNGGNGGGGNDEGGSEYFRKGLDEIDSAPPDKAKIVTWFLLLVVLMTFGGLIGAYVVVSTNNVLEWRPFDLPLPVWFSTVLITVSSFTYHFGRKALDPEHQENVQGWFIATAALGGMFVASQILAWLELVNRGMYVYGNPYAGFFYILTAIHALHVIGGIIALGTILLRSWYPTNNADELLYRRNIARSVGWYWHMVGAIWLVLLALLGFWQ
jgi:cytochrome c oxidase subunit 3